MRAIRLTVVVAVLCVAVAWAARPRHEQAATAPRQLPIYSVETSRSAISLTFNGAWGPDLAGDILDILQTERARATFFVLNVWLEQNPVQTQRVVAEGHEIAMHSANHPDFTAISEDRMRSEVRSNCQAIMEATGNVPRLFRAPSGAYDSRVVKVVEDELGFAMIQWDTDSVDWQRPGPDAIVSRVTRGLKPGAIVLFHTNVPETVAALPRIISIARSKGLEMITVSDLLLPPPYHIDHTGRQRPGTE